MEGSCFLSFLIVSVIRECDAERKNEVADDDSFPIDAILSATTRELSVPVVPEPISISLVRTVVVHSLQRA
jgi:hypothetical protein